MTLPRLLAPLALALLIASGAAATPIVPNANLSGTVHNGENHTGANGSNSDLSFASFIGTNLRNTTFLNTNFFSANLTNANLRNTNATGANFKNATLSGAQMRDGNYTNAIFDGAVMTFATLNNANFSGASFLGANLSSTINPGTATWTGAFYNASTVFAAGFNPVAQGMVFVAEPGTATLLGLGLLGLGAFGRRRAS